MQTDDEPRLIARFSERTHGWFVIRAGHFYGDDKVFEVMLFNGLFERQHGELKAAAIVLNVRWWIEYVAIEIGEHPL